MELRMPIYNEYKLSGNDYTVPQKALEWHILNTRQSAELDLSFMPLSSDDVLMDIGCGAGFHLELAATVCRHVHGLDVSKEMLKLAETMIHKCSINNVTLHCAGFLSIPKLEPNPTCAFSWGVLHYLPDFWKFVALLKISKLLPKHGRFCLLDMVYSFDPRLYEKCQTQFIRDVENEQGEHVASDVIAALSEGCVTFDFIIEDLLGKTGFKVIKKASLPSKCWTNYLLEKVTEI